MTSSWGVRDAVGNAVKCSQNMDGKNRVLTQATASQRHHGRNAPDRTVANSRLLSFHLHNWRECDREIEVLITES